MRADMKPTRRRRFRSALLLTLAAGLGMGIGALIALRANPHDQGATRLGQMLRGPALQLQRVDFVGLEALKADQLWQASAVERGTPLIDLDVRAIEERIESHARVARATAVRLPPSRLVVVVQERVPVAVDAVSQLGIDAEGERFSISSLEAAPLPSVRGAASRALPLIAAAGRFDTEIISIDARTDDDLSFRPRSAEAIVRVGRNPELAMAGWQQIRRSGLIAGLGAREVDLRFPGSAVLRGLEAQRGE